MPSPCSLYNYVKMLVINLVIDTKDKKQLLYLHCTNYLFQKIGNFKREYMNYFRFFDILII